MNGGWNGWCARTGKTLFWLRSDTWMLPDFNGWSPSYGLAVIFPDGQKTCAFPSRITKPTDGSCDGFPKTDPHDLYFDKEMVNIG